MDEDGQSRAVTVLEALEDRDSTNLWDGLVTGLDVLKNSDRNSRLASVLLLTDGEPNIHPPKGYSAELRAYQAKNNVACIVNTFGFSYSVNSSLLRQLAEESDGSYAFIPDSGFVGTCFVNSMSTLLSTYAQNVVVEVAAEDAEVQFVGYSSEVNTRGLQEARVGLVQFGQSRDIVVKLTSKKGPLEAATVHSKISFTLRTGPSAKSQTVNVPAIVSSDEEKEIRVQNFRLAVVAAIFAGTADPKQFNPSFNGIAALIAEIEAYLQQVQDERLAGLLKDLKGEITFAFQAHHYKKWGRHYAPSLATAHRLQQCNNFKDPGVQFYGGELFEQLRDQADDVFLSLPPPKPSRPLPQDAGGRPLDVHRYYDHAAVCFAAHCEVQLSNGESRRCDAVRAGDSVQTPSGPATVLCVVETVLPGPTPMVELGPLLVTPYHPIRVDGAWVFPHELGRSQSVQVPSVFSFLLDQGHVMLISGFECASLAHGFTEEKVEHPYFGTSLVSEDLRQMQGWSQGHVKISPSAIIRSPKTDLVMKLAPEYELI